MPNERKTEAMVRDRLKDAGYYNSQKITVEEQKSDSPRIKKHLKNASKSGDGPGFPEFIISSSSHSDFLIIIECKADVNKHASDSGDRYAEYAVDGTKLYASYLSQEFDVIGISVSGETESTVQVSQFMQLKGDPSVVDFQLDQVLPLDEYVTRITHSEVRARQDYEKLLAYSRDLNEQLHAAKIKESQRGLLICGILLALKNDAFRSSFKRQKNARQLAANLVDSILNEFNDADLSSEKINTLGDQFAFIKQDTTLTTDKDFFVGLIEEIEHKINTFITTHRYYDAISQFYVQFLRYANNDKGLGIVLTPPHVAELFA